MFDKVKSYKDNQMEKLFEVQSKINSKYITKLYALLILADVYASEFVANPPKQEVIMTLFKFINLN